MDDDRLGLGSRPKFNDDWIGMDDRLGLDRSNPGLWMPDM